ncbi:MAG: DUF2284 domain-containing protein [Methanomassiliicoccaceae archaeon]|nr:DUF2284 domain-containing protein [Methanomassiliicoccaceae archaeon]
MIDDVWGRMSGDPAAEGYLFKKICPPSPDEASMRKCRGLCAENACGAYGTTWGCPPGVGPEAECLGFVRGFPRAAVLMKRFDGIDVGDRDLVEKLGGGHQDVCRRFAAEMRRDGHRAVALSDGGCRYCGQCSYPGGPCRFPDQMVPSISSYGIMMDEYMAANGIDFEFRKDGMTLYGLILYDGP